MLYMTNDLQIHQGVRTTSVQHQAVISKLLMLVIWRNSALHNGRDYHNEIEVLFQSNM